MAFEEPKARLGRIFLSPQHMGGEELHFIKEAFDSNYVAHLGPMVNAFEREFAEVVGIRHCAAVSSGTAVMPQWNSFTSVKLASPRLNSLGFNRASILRGKHSTG